MNALARKTAVVIATISLMFCALLGFAYPNTAEAAPGGPYLIDVGMNPASGCGSVSVNGTTYQSGYSSMFNEGEEIQLDATPASGWEFVNWTAGDSVVSSTPSFTYAVTDRANLKANFRIAQPQIQSYIISIGVQSNGMGTISIDGGAYGVGGTATYDEGDTISLNAQAASGYRFVNWTADGAVVSTNQSFNYKVEGKVSLLAHFEKAPTSYMVNIGIHSNGMGNITINGNSQTGLSGSYDEGTQFELTAEAAAGYRFVNWTNGDEVVSTDPDFTYTVTGRTDLYANFEKAPASYFTSIDLAPTGVGSITINGEDSKGITTQYDEGTQLELTAETIEGWRFVNWTNNGTVVSTDPNFTFTVNGETRLLAHFEKIPASYIVSINTSPFGTGNITINGNASQGITAVYDEGEEITLTAEPINGYRFVSWTADGVVVNTDPNFIYTVTNPASLVANFEKVTGPVVDPDDPNNPPADPKDPTVTDPNDDNGGDNATNDEEDSSKKSDDSEDKAKSDDSKEELPKTADNSLYALGALGFVGFVSLIAALIAARRRA